ncbi:MAG TPA: hypothetical protein VFW38_12575 [Solirubrobacteraceae bacterium]|nr:hypothetical protein [Solirubrobacteraceae bacterium]
MSTPENAASEQDGAEEHGEPQACMPCHGSGQVISNLGGTQSKVTCPWCQGGGVRIVGSDAQEYRREQDG